MNNRYYPLEQMKANASSLTQSHQCRAAACGYMAYNVVITVSVAYISADDAKAAAAHVTSLDHSEVRQSVWGPRRVLYRVIQRPGKVGAM